LWREAGQNFYVAIMFFCATAVLLPVLGVAAIARAKGLQSLVRRIDPVFAVLFTALLYLTIGPLFAIPRAANMPFDIAVKPFIAHENLQIWLFFYSAAYFALNFSASDPAHYLFPCRRSYFFDKSVCTAASVFY